MALSNNDFTRNKPMEAGAMDNVNAGYDFYQSQTQAGKNYMGGVMVLSRLYPEQFNDALSNVDRPLKESQLDNTTANVIRGIRNLARQVPIDVTKNVNEFLQKDNIKPVIQNNNLWSKLSADVMPKVKTRDLPKSIAGATQNLATVEVGADGTRGQADSSQMQAKINTEMRESRQNDAMDNLKSGDFKKVNAALAGTETIAPKPKRRSSEIGFGE